MGGAAARPGLREGRGNLLLRSATWGSFSRVLDEGRITEKGGKRGRLMLRSDPSIARGFKKT